MVITVSQQPVDFVLQGRASQFKVRQYQRMRLFSPQLRGGDGARVSRSVLIDARKHRMKGPSCRGFSCCWVKVLVNAKS